jgi:hypothetical protein
MPDLKIDIWYDEEIEVWIADVYTETDRSRRLFIAQDVAYGVVIKRLIEYLEGHS